MLCQPWPNIWPTSLVMLGQHWKLMLGQSHFVQRPNVGPMSLCDVGLVLGQRCADHNTTVGIMSDSDVRPTSFFYFGPTLGQHYANRDPTFGQGHFCDVGPLLGILEVCVWNNQRTALMTGLLYKFMPYHIMLHFENHAIVASASCMNSSVECLLARCIYCVLVVHDRSFR